MMNKFIGFLKNEVVLCAALVLAAVSMVAVPPNPRYAEYIDFRVLALLFCLMLVVAGFKSVGVFEKLIELLLRFVKNTRQLALVLVIICFVLSMWITNDVALITFVPFAVMIFRQTKKTKHLPLVAALQTVAVNLGSMCTPVGNPQNLYLYTISEMPIMDFVKLLLPYTVVSLFLLIGACFMVKKEPLTVGGGETTQGLGERGTELSISEHKTKRSVGVWRTKQGIREPKTERENERNIGEQEKRTKIFKTAIYMLLFVISILTVLRVVHYMVMLAVVVIVVAVVEPKLFKEADYMLLITFVAFFIFVGNVKQIDAVSGFLSKWVSGNEVIVSVLASQLISNVPAAVLLSGFTNDFAGLLVGTNLGGLGTLIASMASLISYKYIAKAPECSTAGYIGIFTAVNAVFLAVLLVIAFIV